MSEQYKEIIVCAAIKHTESGTIVCGVRHFDEIMHSICVLAWPDYNGGHFEQGFVNNRYEFLDREQAKAVVLQNNQVLREQPTYVDLYSENLY